MAEVALAPIALNRKLPLWYQVAQSLRAAILTRRAEDGLRLPTEAELARHYGVSLITVRQALKSVEEEGLVSRRRRRGTFINPEARTAPKLKLLGSIESVVAQQSSEEVVVLGKASAAPPPEIAEHFPGLGELTLFRRLRKEAGVPVSYAENYVLPEYGERIEADDLTRLPMTRLVRDAGAPVARIENSIEARLATPELARLLEVAVLAPILHLTGASEDGRGRVVDLASISYRGDRYKFAVAVDVS